MARNREVAEAEREIGQLIENLSSASINRLPTESELVERLSCGRYTVRKAVEHFVSQGTLEKVQGRGTFIVSKKNTVAFSGWIGTEPPGDVAVHELLDGFHSRFRDIHVDYSPVPYYQTIEKTIESALRGQPPDVIQLTPPLFAALNDFHLFMPLDEVLNHSNLRRRYPIDIDSGRVGRKLYAITWGLSPLILYYNKNVLRSAGIDPSRPPETLDELKAMCVRINRVSDGQNRGISLPLSKNDPNFLWLYPYFLAFGGGFADARSGNIVIDSDENRRTLEWLTELHRDGGVPGVKDITEARMLFAADRLGFWVDGPWLRGLFRQLSGFKEEFDSHYGVTRIPVGPSGRSESILWNHSLAITSRSRNVQEAHRWIEYLTTEEECARKHFTVLGTLPPLRDILHSPFFSDDPFARCCIEQMETVSILPIQHPLFSKSAPFVSHVISEIISQSQDPSERLAFLTEIVQIINQNRFMSIFSH